MGLGINEQDADLRQEQLQLEQRNRATDMLYQFWEEALKDGIDPDILSEILLRTALMDMVQTSSEEYVVDFVSDLPDRVERGEFTPRLVIH